MGGCLALLAGDRSAMLVGAKHDEVVPLRGSSSSDGAGPALLGEEEATTRSKSMTGSMQLIGSQQLKKFTTLRRPAGGGLKKIQRRDSLQLQGADEDLLLISCDSQRGDSAGGGDDLSKEDLKLLSKSLQRHFLFTGLDDDEVAIIIRRMKRKTVQPEEVLFRQGDTGDCLYCVTSGQLTVTIDGKHVRTMKRGAVGGSLLASE